MNVALVCVCVCMFRAESDNGVVPQFGCFSGGSAKDATLSVESVLLRGCGVCVVLCACARCWCGYFAEALLSISQGYLTPMHDAQERTASGQARDAIT